VAAMLAMRTGAASDLPARKYWPGLCWLRDLARKPMRRRRPKYVAVTANRIDI